MATKMTLLVVDDDEAVLALLRTKLERTGRYDVLTAGGGNEALQRVRERRPDLIVCDIDMPDMDGGALAAALKEGLTTRTLPVVFLSGLVSPQDSARGAVGGWPMLSKQSKIEHLVAKIDELLTKTP
jgi:CheY-like chemotaxis protein